MWKLYYLIRHKSDPDINLIPIYSSAFNKIQDDTLPSLFEPSTMKKDLTMKQKI